MTKALIACWVALACLGGFAGEEVDQEAIIRELLARSRFLEDVQFRVARSVWEGYIRETLQPTKRPAPVAMIAGEGVYALSVPADRKPRLAATLRLRVFDPERCANTPVLSSALAWEAVQVGGQPATLATVGGWLRFSPTDPGEYVVSARIDLKEAPASGHALRLAIPATVRTILAFDSPDAWEAVVEGEGAARQSQGGQSRGAEPRAMSATLRGEAAAGTHGQLAVTPRGQLRLDYHPPVRVSERPPRFFIKGDVAWNLDAATQQVAAELDIGIAGGSAERIELRLAPEAEQVEISGPDVREARVAAGAASVFLRGKIQERTRLRVSYEMPLAKTGTQTLGELVIADGHWEGGTLVVTNTAGGSEVLAATMSGLQPLAVAAIPESARAILAGPPALAYGVAGRSWSAEVEVLNLGEFALQESIADLAHYELAFQPDGTLLCKASYEVRNRSRQFLRLDLPKGSVVLQARVNEEAKPLSPVPDAPDAYLLPLIRSLASVKGLVTFPVDVVFLCRVDALVGSAAFRPFLLRAKARTTNELELPLPRVDVPIAYAWCEAYVPEKMRVKRWAGPLREVEKYSNETATASLDYGLGLAAEGYQPKARPVPTIDETRQALVVEAPRPEDKKAPSSGRGLFSWLGPGKAKQDRAAREQGFFADELTAPERTPPPPTALPPPQEPQGQPAPAIQPPANQPVFAVDLPSSSLGLATGGGKALLWKNYYRAGKDFYERQDYASAARSLEQAVALNPKSQEADNARKLLDNIKLVTGEQAGVAGGFLLKSQSEKAAGARVKREVEAGQRVLVEQQQEYLEKGIKASREGRVQDAKANLEAAESLSGQLLGQGANKAEQDALLRSARSQLGWIREQEGEQAKGLAKKVQEFKGKGRLEEALKAAKELQQLDVSGKTGVQHEVQRLALDVAKQKSEELDTRRLGERLSELNKRVDEQRRKLATHGEGLQEKLEEEVTVDFGSSLIQPQPMFRGTPPKLADIQKAVKHLERLDAEQKQELSRLEAPKTLVARKPKPPAKRGEALQEQMEALDMPLARLKELPEQSRGRLMQRAELVPGPSPRRPATSIGQEIAEGVTTPEEQAAQDLLDRYKSESRVSGDQRRFLANQHVAVARAHTINGAWSDALANYRKAMELEPGNKQAQEGLKKAETILKVTTTRFGDLAKDYAQQRAVAIEAQTDALEKMLEDGKQLVEQKNLAGAVETLTRVSARAKYLAPSVDTGKIAQEANSYLDKALAGMGKSRGERKEAPRIVAERTLIERDKLQDRLTVSERDVHNAYKEIERLTHDLTLDSDLLARVKERQPEVYKDITRGVSQPGPRPPRTAGPSRERAEFTLREKLADREREFAGAMKEVEWLTEELSRSNDMLQRLKEREPGMYTTLQRPEAALRPKKVIRGKVTGVDKGLGVVVLNIGQRHEVRKGHQFIVFRGNEYVGKVIVDEVFPDMSAAHYDRANMKKDVANGDDVTTRLTVDLDGWDAADGPLARATEKMPEKRPATPLHRVEKKPVEKPVLRTYDVTDLTIDIKHFQARQSALASDLGYSQRGGQQGQAQQELAQEFFGAEDDGKKKSDKLSGEELTEFIKKTIAPGTWGDGDFEGVKARTQEKPGEAQPYTVQYRNGRIVVVHRPEVREQVENLLGELRRARGPQVELGRQITTQQAKGVGKGPAVGYGFNYAAPAAREGDAFAWPMTPGASDSGYVSTGSSFGGGQVRRDERFQQFVNRNYDWFVNPRGFQAHSKGPQAIIDAADRGRDEDDITNFGAGLVEKLDVNKGQKVQVNGINLNVAPGEAAGLGVAFNAGKNGVNYAVVDEAQLRTLLELDAAAKARRVAANPNAQETIVGTDAWLPNEMRANIRFAGEFGNTLDINGNDIDLPHQKYILISNGGFLTAVQANPMQHWTEAMNPFPFVVTEQEIAVPRVGRLVKFEKTLIEPGDELVLKASYRYSR